MDPKCAYCHMNHIQIWTTDRNPYIKIPFSKGAMASCILQNASFYTWKLKIALDKKNSKTLVDPKFACSHMNHIEIWTRNWNPYIKVPFSNGAMEFHFAKCIILHMKTRKSFGWRKVRKSSCIQNLHIATWTTSEFELWTEIRMLRFHFLTELWRVPCCKMHHFTLENSK